MNVPAELERLRGLWRVASPAARPLIEAAAYRITSALLASEKKAKAARLKAGVKHAELVPFVLLEQIGRSDPRLPIGYGYNEFPVFLD
jgi:hypothetical protein